MASRKEEKERLRRERLEAERRASAGARKRLILGYVVAGILALAVIGGIVFAIFGGGDDSGGQGEDTGENVDTRFGALPKDLPVDERVGTPPPEIVNGDLEGAAAEAGCELQLDLPEEGNAHFTDIDKEPEYKTSPPTSGDHYFNPTESGSGALADGAFLETPPFNRVVHSFEHGRVAVQYSSELSEEDQLALKGIFDTSGGGVDLFPNDEMPYDVAVTAWTQLMGCKTYEGGTTLDAIRDFREEFRGRGPEPVEF